MKILILGSTGMLGHVVKRYFENKNYEVYATTREKEDPLYFDLNEDIKNLEKIIKVVKPDVVINCIGVLNKACEDNKALAVLANSYLPHYVDSLSNNYNFKFLHVSTDCVFDGRKGNYDEFSEKDAASFYGKSKGLGEVINDKNVTLRTSIVGPDESSKGIGLFKWFMDQEVSTRGFTNVVWTGVTTVELASRIEEAVSNNLTGLYHVVNGKVIDKYSLLCLFKKYFNKDIEIIKDDSVVSNKSLIVTRKDYKFDVPEYDEMIKNMRSWVEENIDLYPKLIKKINGKCK